MNPSILITPNQYGVGKLLSIIPTDGSGDLDVVRATSPTRVDANGLVEIPRTNLILRSEEFNDAYWASSSAQRTVNYALSPNGTMTANRVFPSGSSNQNGISTTSFLPSVQTKSIYAKADGYQYIQINWTVGYSLAYANFDIINGTVTVQSGGTATITNEGDGWFRCSFYAIGTTVTGLHSYQIIPESNSVRGLSWVGDPLLGVLIWGAQIEAGVTATEYIPTIASIRTRFAGITQDGGSASNIPRLDYTNGSCPSILVEPQRTNLLLRSEEFDNASWVKIDATISANATNSPSGTLTADKLIEGSLTGQHYATRNITNQNALFSFSIFAKKSERNFLYLQAFATSPNNFTYVPFAYFNLDNGTVGNVSGATATIQDFDNGWYRCTLNCTSIFSQLSATVGMYIMTATANGVNSYLGNGTSGIFIWGAQAEAGSNATSYIPTVASAVTRNADVISKTGISDLIGQSEGTIFLEVNLRKSSILGFLIQLSDGTNNNRVQIVFDNSLFWQVTGNNLVGINGSFDFVDNSLIKIAFGYKNGDSIFYINGVEATSLGKMSANIPLSLNRIDFAKNHTSNFPINCNINKALLFKTRLSNQECINLTTL
jgi:hypothetical protein